MPQVGQTLDSGRSWFLLIFCQRTLRDGVAQDGMFISGVALAL